MSIDSRVMTVLGPVASSELGVTLPHEHLVIDLTRQVIQYVESFGARVREVPLPDDADAPPRVTAEA